MLYIVSTPIGNLGDISERALKTLRSVDIIIAESITDAMRLLNAYEIKGKKILKFNDRNKKSAIKNIIEILSKNDAVYISSAGTPGISDPGSDLVLAARDNGVKLSIIPGPSALISAVAMSGMRMREFAFLSFLPKKKGQISNLFLKHKKDKSNIIFFESTFRIVKTIEILLEVAPECEIFVAKEMTKIFENYFKGRPIEVLEKLKEGKNLKGEFVVIVSFSG